MTWMKLLDDIHRRFVLSLTVLQYMFGEFVSILIVYSPRLFLVVMTSLGWFIYPLTEIIDMTREITYEYVSWFTKLTNIVARLDSRQTYDECHQAVSSKSLPRNPGTVSKYLYTWDIAVFIPLTKFEYYLEK